MGSLAVELGDLLAGTAGAVVDAQRRLDADAQERTRAWLDDEPGPLVPPPLWHVCREAAIEVELSTTVTSSTAGAPRLVCRLLDPVTANVFGVTSAASTRVRLLLAPRETAVVPAGAVGG